MPYLIVTSIPASKALEREQVRPDHLLFLESSVDIILAAGAKLLDDGAVAEGSFYLLDLETRAEASAFIERDPYVERGLVTEITLTRVRSGFFDRRRSRA